jgi:signal transduction histidine kinase
MARIVVIDDDDALREVVSEMVADAGHTVFAAASGADGIALVKREHPDLVVCDVEMPGGIDGHGVLAAVRADAVACSTPFLFLTGLGEPGDVRSGMNLGADDYLVKPVVTADLLKAIDTRLARTAADRQQSNRRIDELRRSVALLLPHELRTPLTTIIGGAGLLREARAGLPPEAIDDLLDSIVRSAERLQRLIENYLTYAGLEVARLAGESVGSAASGTAGPAEIEEAAREAAREVGREADLQLELDATAALPLGPTYLRKLVGELVRNALKFSKAGSPVRVSLRAEDGHRRLTVADAGRGMSDVQIAEVGAFRQFDRALFEQQGSGLGLAIVNGIAAASGGRLELRATPAKGTTAILLWGE